MSLQLIIVLILIGGWLFGRLATRCSLPNVLGMTLWGLLIGMFWRDLIPQVLWDIAPFLKSLALIVILLRAGLGIRIRTLRKVGAVVLRMSFIPALCEALVLTLLFHVLLNFNWLTSALAATVLSAVSPAVVVPSMLRLKECGYGRQNDVPTMVLAGASLDDVIVITFFTMFLGIARGSEMNLRSLLMLPWSLLVGIIPGLLTGFLLVWFFEHYYEKIRATEKTILLLGISVMLVQIGEWIHTAALLGIMTVGFILLAKTQRVAGELAEKLGKLWIFSEIILFVLIGISVNPATALKAGPLALLIISGGLAARSLGVLLATSASSLSKKEKLFTVIAYIPKATVQAALGALPLQHGIDNGEIILAYAVLAILFTAPLGLTGIRIGGTRLLHMDMGNPHD